MMSSIVTKLTSHQLRRASYTSLLGGPHFPSTPLLTPIVSASSADAFTQPSSKLFHTSTIVQRPREDRDPKIKITLEQLRMAARGSGRRAPICHDQQEKVMNALEAANYENSLIYKYIIEYDKCREDYERNHKGKDRSMMKELNKYLVRKRKK